jgi:hypothetical protein
MRQELTAGPPGPPSLGQMPIFVYSHGQAVPAASLRRLDHHHDTFPCPSHRDQQRRTNRSPAGSTRLEPLTPQNLATSAKVPPGHPVPVLTITTTSWPRSHGPGPYMTPRQPPGLQPHPAREQRSPKRLFPHLKKSQEKNEREFKSTPWLVPADSLRRLDHPHDTFPCSSHRDLSFKTLRTPAGSTRLENRPTKPGHLGQGAIIRCPLILDQAESLPHFLASFT